MCIQDIFSTYITPIGQFLMVLVTFALVLLTVKYIKATKRMADVMSQEFEIRTKPAVDIYYDGFEGDDLVRSFIFRIENKGNYQVKFMRYSLSVTHENFRSQIFHSFSKGIERFIMPGKDFKAEHKHDLSGIKQLPLKDKEKTLIYLDVTFMFKDIFEKSFSEHIEIPTNLGKI